MSLSPSPRKASFHRLEQQHVGEVGAYLESDLYANAMPYANLTQLRERCEVVVARDFCGRVRGMAAHYRDLPFMTLTFAVDEPGLLAGLVPELVRLVPRLANEPFTTVIPEFRLAQLARVAVLERVQGEIQLSIDIETLGRVAAPRSGDSPAPGSFVSGAPASGRRGSLRIRRLEQNDLPAMKKLAAEQGLLAFRPEVLDNGPAFGAFDGDRLVSMAATHFLTPEIAEIGNVVTAMDFRRRGLARTCTHALAGECFRTTERVFLMVVEENRFAYELYRGMGFRERGRFALVDASLKPGPIDKRE